MEDNQNTKMHNSWENCSSCGRLSQKLVCCDVCYRKLLVEQTNLMFELKSNDAINNLRTDIKELQEKVEEILIIIKTEEIYRRQNDKIRATRRKLPIKAEKALNRLRSRA